MSDADKKLQEILEEFQKEHPAAGKSLRAILEATPALKERYLDAVAQGSLQRITALDPAKYHPESNGSYFARDGRLELRISALEEAASNNAKANSTRVVLAHEIEHALHRDEITAERTRLKSEARDIATGPAPHDYTGTILSNERKHREREATDQLSAINLLTEHISRENPNLKGNALYEKLYKECPVMQRYFTVVEINGEEIYQPLGNLDFDERGKLAITKENTEAMAEIFYDAQPAYARGYRIQALLDIIRVEYEVQQANKKADPGYQPAPILVNLEKLDLKDVKLPPGVLDASVSGRTAREAQLLSSAALSARLSNAMVAPIEEWQGPALYQQSLATLEKLGPDAGFKSREELSSIAAALAVKAQNDGLSQIDLVLLSQDGKGLIAVQGDPATAQAKNTYIDRADAAQQPLDANLAQLQRGQAEGQTTDAAQLAAQQQRQQQASVTR